STRRSTSCRTEASRSTCVIREGTSSSSTGGTPTRWTARCLGISPSWPSRDALPVALMGLVAVTDHPFPDLAIAREILEGAGHTLVEHHCRTGEEVAAACADADGLLNTYAPIPAAPLRRLRVR